MGSQRRHLTLAVSFHCLPNTHLQPPLLRRLRAAGRRGRSVAAANKGRGGGVSSKPNATGSVKCLLPRFTAATQSRSQGRPSSLAASPITPHPMPCPVCPPDHSAVEEGQLCAWVAQHKVVGRAAWLSNHACKGAREDASSWKAAG
jgi:hypothetical protein